MSTPNTSNLSHKSPRFYLEPLTYLGSLSLFCYVADKHFKKTQENQMREDLEKWTRSASSEYEDRISAAKASRQFIDNVRSPARSLLTRLDIAPDTHHWPFFLELSDLSLTELPPIPYPEKLHTLVANNNSFRETLSLAPFISLRSLSLRNCDLTQFPNISHLSQLNFLDISGNYRLEINEITEEIKKSKNITIKYGNTTFKLVKNKLQIEFTQKYPDELPRWIFELNEPATIHVKSNSDSSIYYVFPNSTICEEDLREIKQKEQELLSIPEKTESPWRLGLSARYFSGEVRSFGKQIHIHLRTSIMSDFPRWIYELGSSVMVHITYDSISETALQEVKNYRIIKKYHDPSRASLQCHPAIH